MCEDYQSWLKMPPIQGRARGVHVGAGWGTQATQTNTQRELRQLQARMEAMERIISKIINTRDEGESSKQEKGEIADEVKVLRMLVKASNMLKVEVPMYEGNMNVEERMD